jgi:hypothetical protein
MSKTATGILLASAHAVVFAGPTRAAQKPDATGTTGTQIHGSGTAGSESKRSTNRGSESDTVGSAGTRRRGNTGIENKGGVRGGSGGSGAPGAGSGGPGNVGTGDRNTDAMGDHGMGSGSSYSR